ncbi:MAG TPA: GxxExxY protein [Caulobacteraceae bacterium]|jgi:GxxExxY protein
MDHGKHGEHGKLLFEQETFQVRAAAFEVSRQLGVGFLEAVYQEAFALELEERQIPHVAAPALAIEYKGRLLTQTYRPDFVCFDHIIVELKAVRELAPEHRAQTLNSLKATGLKVGLLVNFGCAPKARVERFVL